jgi:hypothetical protein
MSTRRKATSEVPVSRRASDNVARLTIRDQRALPAEAVALLQRIARAQELDEQLVGR